MQISTSLTSEAPIELPSLSLVLGDILAFTTGNGSGNHTVESF